MAAVEDVVDQRRFAAAGNARDHDERAQRELDVDVLEVVLARAPYHELLAVSRAARRRRSHATRRPTGTGRSSESGFAAISWRRSRGHQLAAEPSRARAEIDHVVGALDGLLRRAPPPAPCCPGRAGGPACRAGARCRAGAGRWTARRARTARRAAWSRSASPAGCAALRRRRAWPPSGPGSDSPGRPPRGTPGGGGSPPPRARRSALALGELPAAHRRQGARDRQSR